MIYVYFFIKCVVRWSENSVRFEKSYGNRLPHGPNSVRFYLSVRYGIYDRCLVFGQILRLLLYFMFANSEGSGGRRLCDKYHNLNGLQ